jgi:hypothetical protein
MRPWILVFALASALAMGCGSAEEGVLTLTLSGSDATTGDGALAETVDGWTLTFDRALVTLDSVELGRAGKDPTLTHPASLVWDVTVSAGEAGGHPLLAGIVPAGTYDTLAFRIWRAQGATTGGNVDDNTAKLMLQNGYSVYVQGTATRGEEEVAFSWGFTQTTNYSDCALAADLPDGAEAVLGIEVAIERIFRDALGSGSGDADGGLRFDPIAGADSDGDGVVTAGELSERPVETADGYSPAAADLDSLWALLGTQVHDIVRVQGGGTCLAISGSN